MPKSGVNVLYYFCGILIFSPAFLQPRQSSDRVSVTLSALALISIIVLFPKFAKRTSQVDESELIYLPLHKIR